MPAKTRRITKSRRTIPAKTRGVIPARIIPFGGELTRGNLVFGSRAYKKIGANIKDGQVIAAFSPKDGICHLGYIEHRSDGKYFIARQHAHVDPAQITGIYKLPGSLTYKIGQDGTIPTYEFYRALTIKPTRGTAVSNVKK